MPLITLINGVTFECSRDESILSAAKKTGIALEHSCMTGRCGVCKTSVKSGSTEQQNGDYILSETEREYGYILTCCCSPVTDVELNIEDLGAIGKLKTAISPCRVDRLIFLNDDVAELTLRIPPNFDFKFIAGQYIDLIGEGGVRRSYSLANSPRDDKKLVLHIKKVRNGVMSEYIFNRARANDLLRLEGPLGTFSLRNDGSENIVFLATGTGIAPVKAMIESIKSQLKSKKIYVIWGGKYKKDLYWDLSNLNIDHIYIPVLSREKNWDGENGHVQQALLDLKLKLDKTTVYACGSELMIKDSRRLLIENGLNENRFHSDAFLSSN
jgi:CDP-4-dehydro-6-deoxyglucose reductase